jgi:5,10-methylenetetrahydromethanopterin reductase
MQVGAGLDARLGLSFGELVEAAREAKRLGFESVWTPAGGAPDAFHVCSAWAQATALPTGTSVVPAARMWTTEALAMQATTVAQLGGSTFTLGIGTGGLGADGWAAPEMPERPVAAMRRYLVGLRRPADRAGFQLGLAALGPQMLRLAGELADVVLPNWSTPAAIADARVELAAGAARAQRDPSAVRVAMYVRVCVDDDVALARRTLGGWASTTSSPSSRRVAPPGRRPTSWSMPRPTSCCSRSGTSVRPTGRRPPTVRSRWASTRRSSGSSPPGPAWTPWWPRWPP